MRGFGMVAAIAAIGCHGCGDQRAAAPAPAIDLRQALAGGDANGFARAEPPAALVFPRDHGPHPAFRTEWWYWTGNVATADGRAFGVQLVFFRQALQAPGGPSRAASLASDTVVLAHAAVGDCDGGRFHFEERLLRLDGVRAGLRGGAEPLHLFAGDWSARAASAGDGFTPVHLAARGREFAFALDLQPGKPLVLQGDAGHSQKGAAAGNASYYYSATRLPVAGTVTVDGAPFAVTGTAWCDREWSTSALDDGQVGWDWFSLQLDDDTELMWYRLRRSDGSADPHSQGVVVDRAGRAERLRAGDVLLQPQGSWRADDGGATYPAAWTLAIPRLQLELVVTPRLLDQELRTLVRYWEGAVAVRGRRGAAAIGGCGFLEMTGYAR